MSDTPTAKDWIQVELLEKLIEHYIREIREMQKTIKISGDHYTYRDKARACFILRDELTRWHMAILQYKESTRRIREIEDAIWNDSRYVDSREEPLT
jgi:hypothetical protein